MRTSFAKRARCATSPSQTESWRWRRLKGAKGRSVADGGKDGNGSMGEDGAGGITFSFPQLSPLDACRYDRYFVLLDKSRRGVVSIDEAWLLFEKPRLQLEQLDIIWNLVSVGPDNLLTLPKFRVAVHLARLANQVVL
eukprot:6173349-Pleurochrysis_carterae.AAC.7